MHKKPTKNSPMKKPLPIKKLLIVEDDPGLQSQLKWCFDGVEVSVAESRESALTALRRHMPQVITLDLGLPPDAGGSSVGFALLEEILALSPQSKVIIVTGQGETAHAIKAIGMGAYDFYQKPIDSELLNFTVNRAFIIHELEEHNRQLTQRVDSTKLNSIIATSASMLKLCRTVEKIAPTDISTLLLGETGTGKELIAQSIHQLSERKDQAFIAINCAAIPENLLESELFGYEKGAFTGASQQKKGKLEAANGGTLFLDEVGDMPLNLQAKLLRFLQERVIERIGGHKQIEVDVRIVCATHRNLESMIAENTFREDLFYRISEMVIEIPPLRERTEDAALIARAFVEKFNQEFNQNSTTLSPAAVRAIQSHAWPGNVRELINKVKRAVILCENNQISPEDLQLTDIGETETPFNLKAVRDRAEKEAVTHALTSSAFNIAQASRELGITRPTLYNLMSKHGIEYDQDT